MLARRVAGDALAAARERGLARPQHRRGARARSATPTTPTGSPSIRRPARSCGCSASPAGRSTASSRAARACTSCSTRRRGCASSRWSWSLLLVARRQRRRVLVARAAPPPSGRITLGEVVVFAQSAVGASMIAFGGLSWALDGAAAPVAAVLRLEPAMAPAGALPSGTRTRRRRCRRARSASATSRSPIPGGAPVLDGLRPDDPGRLVARDRRPERRRQDDARQAAVPAVRPAVGRDRGRRRRPARARSRVVALAGHRGVPGLHPLRAAAARQRRAGGRAGRRRSARRSRRRARRTSPASTRCSRAATTAAPICRAGSGSASRSPARCARCSSAPASCCSTSRPRSSTCAARRRSSSASSPRRAHCTTILISHRFSTVRHADRICVLEHGRVVELGTHDELMALRRPLPHDVRSAGAALQRAEDEEGMTYDVLA